MERCRCRSQCWILPKICTKMCTFSCMFFHFMYLPWNFATKVPKMSPSKLIWYLPNLLEEHPYGPQSVRQYGLSNKNIFISPSPNEIDKWTWVPLYPKWTCICGLETDVREPISIKIIFGEAVFPVLSNNTGVIYPLCLDRWPNRTLWWGQKQDELGYVSHVGQLGSVHCAHHWSMQVYCLVQRVLVQLINTQWNNENRF